MPKKIFNIIEIDKVNGTMKVDNNKRNFLKIAALSPLLPIGSKFQLEPEKVESSTPINIIIPKDYVPSIDKDSQLRLKNATLKHLEENYGDVNLTFWNKKPSEIDLEKRIENIIYWMVLAIENSRKIYPIDPAWVIAQIMAESFFYEFAISNDLAVGICQFIPNTAKSYDIIYAGSMPQHKQTPYLLPEYANKVNEFYRLRNQKRSYMRNNRPTDLFTLEETLEILAQNTISDETIVSSQQQLDYLSKLEEFDEQISLVKIQYKEYLEANIKNTEENKDIFQETDFFVSFDERFTYKKPIFAMIDMLTKGLRARNGNILTAAAGYNAGLRSTYFNENVHKSYGKIPAFEETTIYLSRIIGNHHEIVKRM